MKTILASVHFFFWHLFRQQHSDEKISLCIAHLFQNVPDGGWTFKCLGRCGLGWLCQWWTSLGSTRSTGRSSSFLWRFVPIGKRKSAYIHQQKYSHHYPSGNLCCFFAKRILSQIHALFGVNFPGIKMRHKYTNASIDTIICSNSSTQLNIEVCKFICQGSGSFTTKMLDVTAEGFSSIVPVENAEGKQVNNFYRIGLAVCVSLCYQKTSASFTEATYKHKQLECWLLRVKSREQKMAKTSSYTYHLKWNDSENKWFAQNTE